MSTITERRAENANNAEHKPNKRREEHMTMTVTVGRNIGNSPMAQEQWERFTTDVLRNVRVNTTHIYFVGFGNGNYEGVDEESFTIVSSDPVGTGIAVRISLELLAHANRQECIALTIGETELVQARH